ncbi:MAG: hypothetical protein IT436_05225 [Phycisphaerales bacterium]|nr:hypothetical protein [Phycisphaerales bacterium]
MAEANGVVMNPGTFLLMFPSGSGGLVVVDPAAVVGVGSSATLGRSMLLIAGGAIEVNMGVDVAAAVIAKATGKAIVSAAPRPEGPRLAS